MRFNINEIAVINDKTKIIPAGTECTIISELEDHFFDDGTVMRGYEVKPDRLTYPLPDCVRLHVEEHELVKLKSHKNISNWNECIWKPEDLK